MTMTDSSRVDHKELALLKDEYWAQTLGPHIPDLSLPWANTAAVRATRVTIEQHLDAELLAKVRKMSTGSPFLVATFAATAFACTLDRFIETHDIVVGVTGLYDRLGDAVVFARLALNDQSTFKEQYVAVRTALQQAHRFNTIDLEALLDERGCQAEQRRHIRQIGVGAFTTPAVLRASFSLFLAIDPASGRLGVELCPEVDSPDLVGRILEQTVRFIHGAAETPYRPIEGIDILPDAECRLVLDKFNAKRAALPNTMVPAMVQDHARRNPDRIAVELSAERMTYGALNRTANRIAARLRRTVPAHGIVAVIMDRAPTMAATILGIWKAGCAYLPLDPEAPEARSLQVLEAARPALVITRKVPAARIAALGAIPVLDLDAQAVELERELADDVALEIGPDDLAYVIFTSGSTGKPKGAMIEHAGMLNHILAKVAELPLDADSVVAQNASQCFDISVWQMFSALCCGAKTVVYSHAMNLDVESFLDDVAREATVLELVPSYFRLLLESLERRPRVMSAMRMLVLNAETLPRNLVERWFRMYPSIPMINAYGPTEASDDVLHHVMTGPPIPDNIPIGRPIHNMNLYVVDRLMRPCPIGVKGDIMVSGIGVGRGYVNDPERTAAAYSHDPFRPERGRMYRTGDLGRWRPDGSMEFFGRRDHQVKVRGFRVELEEIDKVVMRHPEIKHAAAVAVPQAGEQQLHCHFVSTAQLPAEALRSFVAGLLPDYMVPMYFVRWPELPLTPNGKVDRHALLAHVRDTSAQDARPSRATVAPRNELETRLQQVWAKVLKRPELGVTDDFFEIGGDSIKAIRVAGEFGSGMLALDVFNHPTIEALAKHLTGDHGAAQLLHLLTEDIADPQLSIVGIPNSAGDPVSFRGVADALAALNPRCRLYGVALPRTPLSEHDTAESMLVRLANDVAAEILARVEGRLFIFGQCNGSGLALAVGEQLQAANRELVGVGIGGILPRVTVEHEDDPFRTRWAGTEIIGMLKQLGATMPDDPADLVFFLRDFRYDAGIANAYFNDCNRRIRSAGFVKLHVPLYCFVGDRDPMVEGYQKRNSAWYRQADSVRVVEFRGLGHYLLRDQPGQFAHELDQLARQGSVGAVVEKPGVLARLFQR